jgi:hypothetical protein
MAQIKKVHEEAFKAKVALESVRGDLTGCPLQDDYPFVLRQVLPEIWW